MSVGDRDLELVEQMRRAGVGRGDLVGLVVAEGVGLGLASPTGDVSVAIEVDDPSTLVRPVEQALRPRWVVWSNDTAITLARSGVRIATCWDVAAVHRLLYGGWRADPALAWALTHGLAPEAIPTTAPPDLFTHAQYDDDDPDEPVRRDGYLSPEWLIGGWSATPDRLRRWAELAATIAQLQRNHLADRPRASATARSESAAELLCGEMSIDGLPMDRAVAEQIVAGFIGGRPSSEAEAAHQRALRDARVLDRAPPGGDIDLRSPGQVKALLSRAGIQVPDTRAWRLKTLRDSHPLIDALLVWRKAERMLTTYGYSWLDEHLGDDGRLRGAWTGSDGASGRMTASAGLHNMPGDMRAAVIADLGHTFVRADLGQIEPRVLAAVSGDAALARATLADDMYAPVAAELGVDRATAKVAVLGAMYGQTTGHGADALSRLEAAYPVAMAYLRDAARAGEARRDLRTYGGRLIRMGSANTAQASEQIARGQAAARGRYGRNALVQGAAAELFKVWAVTVRARVEHLHARIVLCLHDELLVHVPSEHGDTAARLVDECLQEAAHRWAPDDSVRFVADIAVIHRWSDAKE